MKTPSLSPLCASENFPFPLQFRDQARTRER